MRVQLVGGPLDGCEYEVRDGCARVCFPKMTRREYYLDSPWANYPSGWYPVYDTVDYELKDGRWVFVGQMDGAPEGAQVREVMLGAL